MFVSAGLAFVLYILVFCKIRGNILVAGRRVRLRLHRPPARHLVGAGHTCVVALARCAFASAPEWLDEERYMRLEQATGMAKVLLEHVVHGDELDVIWAGLNADDGEDEWKICGLTDTGRKPTDEDRHRLGF